MFLESIAPGIGLNVEVGESSSIRTDAPQLVPESVDWIINGSTEVVAST